MTTADTFGPSPELVDEDTLAPLVWWIPGVGLVVSHAEDRGVFVVVTRPDGKAVNGQYIDLAQDAWPGGAQVLSPNTRDWQRAAVKWQRFTQRMAHDVDAARYEADERIALVEKQAAEARRAEAHAQAERSRALGELAALKERIDEVTP